MKRAVSVVTSMLVLAALPAGCSSGQGARTSGPASRSSAPGRVRTGMLRLPGAPDGLAVSAGGQWSFASLPGRPGRPRHLGRPGRPGRIAVSAQTALAPRLARVIELPADNPSGLALTHDGRLLVAAAGRSAVVLSVARATRGTAQPVLGVLSAPAGGPSGGGGGAEVAIAPDDRFAFVSLERAGVLAVFDLRAVGRRRSGVSGFVGTVPLGIAPLGLAVSPDGRWLYATSESARGPAGPTRGMLTVIDLHRAETDPARSVLATATLPWHPVRVAASPDGRTVWVTARSGDALLGFSAAKLRSRPPHALVAVVRVGEQPIGLAVVDGGRRVIVADSNLLRAPRATAQLAIVDTAAALRGAPALRGTIATGQIPSEIALAPDARTLLVNNSGSDQLEAVDLSRLR